MNRPGWLTFSPSRVGPDFGGHPARPLHAPRPETLTDLCLLAALVIVDITEMPGYVPPASRGRCQCPGYRSCLAISDGSAQCTDSLGGQMTSFHRTTRTARTARRPVPLSRPPCPRRLQTALTDRQTNTLGTAAVLFMLHAAGTRRWPVRRGGAGPCLGGGGGSTEDDCGGSRLLLNQ